MKKKSKSRRSQYLGRPSFEGKSIKISINVVTENTILKTTSISASSRRTSRMVMVLPLKTTTPITKVILEINSFTVLERSTGKTIFTKDSLKTDQERMEFSETIFFSIMAPSKTISSKDKAPSCSQKGPNTKDHSRKANLQEKELLSF